MNAVIDRLASPPGPLAADPAIWTKVIERARTSLMLSANGLNEPASGALTIAVATARLGDPAGAMLLALVRRSLLRAPPFSESALRCLRALARTGEPIDPNRLIPYLDSLGRYARTALATTAELASQGRGAAFALLNAALKGRYAADAAGFMAGIPAEETSLLLQPYLEDPGDIGLHAAAALLSTTHSELAYQALIERLCDVAGAARAAQVLLASGHGRWLMRAERELLEKAEQGDLNADRGRTVAGALLTACGHRADMKAALRALGSGDDQLILIGARAAYWLGDADRARMAVLDLFNRGPTIAAQAFAVLTRWADVGDDQALTLQKGLADHRPVDLSRSAMFEGIAGCTRPVLFGVLVRALNSSDRLQSLEAARAIARLREPASAVPPYGL